VHLPKGEFVVKVQDDEEFIARPIFSKSHPRKLQGIPVAGKS
jgi:predicted ester cyclase